jgi:hypothetical protein
MKQQFDIGDIVYEGWYDDPFNNLNNNNSSYKLKFEKGVIVDKYRLGVLTHYDVFIFKDKKISKCDEWSVYSKEEKEKEESNQNNGKI